ncbi:hypothetical protein SLS54_000577 [Diplodia seriata]
MVNIPFLLSASAASCSASNLFVTSYGGTLSTVTLDSADDGSYSLDVAYSSTGCGASPSWLTLDSERGILYCLDEGLTSTNGTINSLRVDDNGGLTMVTSQQSISGPVSSVLYGSPGARHLAVAHYSGSAVSTWGAPKNGSLIAEERFPYTLAEPGAVPDRQDAPHEHEAILDPTGQFIIVPDLGADLVRVFSYDSAGALTEEKSLETEAGTGPRHAAFWTGHSYYGNSTFFYLVGELDNSVTTYAVTYPAAGGISFTEVSKTTSFGDAPEPEGAAAAEIEVSPDNRFLVVSNRNDSSFEISSAYNGTKQYSDSLTTFSIQPNGSLAFEHLAPAGGSFPRHFSLNGDGDLIAVALQYDSKLVIKKRDIQTGVIGDEIANISIPGNLTSVIWDDIDGVLLRSADPIPGASKALTYLQNQHIPFILLTNGGGKHESERVAEISEKLSLPLSTSNFLQSHTPFAGMDHYKDKTVLVCGGDGAKCRDVAEKYGYKTVVTPGDIYAAYPEIWPFSKNFLDYYRSFARPLPRPIDAANPSASLKIDAVFVYNDPRDWGLDAAIILDVLLSHQGIMGTISPKNGDRSLPNRGYLQDGQPPLYYSNPDLWWAAKYHLSRLGQGGFREAMEGIWAAVTGGDRQGVELKKEVFGKPFRPTYEYAENLLNSYRSEMFAGTKLEPLKRVYMVGDNPESDIRGANMYESPLGTDWKSVLVQTGVYQAGSEPAWKPTTIVKDVYEAVRYAVEDSKWGRS